VVADFWMVELVTLILLGSSLPIGNAIYFIPDARPSLHEQTFGRIHLALICFHKKTSRAQPAPLVSSWETVSSCLK